MNERFEFYTWSIFVIFKLLFSQKFRLKKMTRSLNFLLENAAAEQLCQFKIACVNAAESRIYEGIFTLAKCFAL